MISFELKTFRRFAIVALATYAVSVPAFAQKTFVRPHLLQQDGVNIGIAWDLTGGQIGYDLSFAADGTPLVKQSYIPLDGLYSLYGNDVIFKAIAGALDGSQIPWDHTISPLRKSDVGQLVVLQPRITLVIFPGGDVDSKDPAGVECMHLGQVMQSAGSLTRAESELSLAKKQKLWSAANFRLTIGDLPCSKVKSTAPVQAQFATLIDSKFAGSSCIIPASDAPAFRDLLKQTSAGTPKELPYRFDYLDQDGNVLMSLVSTIVITSVDKGDIFDPFDPSDVKNGDKPVVVQYRFKGHITLIR
jgi:hypothetical protein